MTSSLAAWREGILLAGLLVAMAAIGAYVMMSGPHVSQIVCDGYGYGLDGSYVSPPPIAVEISPGCYGLP